jgi:hypothetical protein
LAPARARDAFARGPVRAVARLTRRLCPRRPRPARTRACPQVSPAKAAQLLGVSEADARQLARGAGWAEAPDGAMLLPRAAPEDGAGLDCRAALEQLVQYMVHLES